MKHTPGPWRYAEDVDDGIHVQHAYVWGPSVTVQDHGSKHCRPDMKLIAAAPELLEACEAAKDALEQMDLSFGGWELVKLLESALAKARGK